VLTVPQAARYVRRNPETVRRWIREGRLRSTRVGTQYLVDQDDLDAIIDGPAVIPSRHTERTATGEPMPNFVAALHRSRSGR
jgi:excisionase family DNA binding protein